MKVVIRDGQGGRLGQALAEAITAAGLDLDLVAVGTNTAATAAMLKGGVKEAATGENPVIVACRTADVIIGPIGILSADSMMGEITPAMAVAVGQSRAMKLLLPVGRCNNQVVGTKSLALSELVKESVERLKALLD